MKTKKLSFVCSLVMVVVLASLLVFAGCKAPAPAPAPAPPTVYEWKLQSVFPRGDLSMETVAYFAESVEERSNGQLKIEVFAEPELVPLPEVFPACSRGTIDIGHGGGAIWAMVVPCGDVEFGGLPRIWNFPDLSIEEGAIKQREFLFESGAADLLRQEYAKYNLYWLDMYTVGSACLLCTKEVHTLADIKGLKLADLGGWMSQWHAMLGWVPVEMLPGSEVEMALALGTIDAVIWGEDGIAALHWNDAAPYWVSNQGLGTHIVQDMLVNMDSWNALPDDLKQALAGAAEDYSYKTIDAFTAQRDEVRTMVEAGEVIECLMDDEYQRAADEAAYELWEVAAEDPASAKLIELIKEFRGIK